MRDEMSDCEKFIRCISEYLDGELDDELRAEFELHLRECMSARAMVRTLQQTIVVHRRAQGAAVPPEVQLRLREALTKCMKCEE
jgi:anti-sigma factor RsiW